MKTVTQGMILFLLFILVIVCVANQFSSTTGTVELESSLDNAVEHALYDGIYTLSTKEQVAAAVMHELFTTCNTAADYTVAFHEIDKENGLVDVCVTQKIGSSAENTCRKTIIWETSN